MKLGFCMRPKGRDYELPMQDILLAESLGFDSVWTAEAYGADAITPLAYIAALTKRIKLGTGIAQIDARTPANLAMSAQTIDFLAGGGRVMLGLGASGPQIVEGWYGRPWGKPNYRLRDTAAIMRKIWRREYVEHHGKEIELPFRGEGSVGLGKPLKNMLYPVAPIPIFIGAETALNIRMAGEIGDGFLAMHASAAGMKQLLGHVEEGLAKRTDGMSLGTFQVQATVGIKIVDDVKAGIQAEKEHIALYAGGMGAKSLNFHKESMIRNGYAQAAERVQELFLAGRRQEAAEAVPDEYVEEGHLIGSKERIAEHYKPWRDSGITSLGLWEPGPEEIKLMAKVALGAKVDA